MANLCFFTMKIVGKKESIEEFTRRMQRIGEFEKNGIGRVYDFDIEDPRELSDGNILVLGYGDCAWSLWCACMKKYRGEQPSLETESERLGLIIEAFSEETGCCFQEHYFINKGILEVNEFVEYHAYWKDGYSEEEWQEMLAENNWTEDDVNENGFIPVGGFEYYCDFIKIKEYLKNIAVEVLE